MSDQPFVAAFTRAHEVEAPYLHSTGPALSRFFTAMRDDCEIWGRRCQPCGRVVVPANDHCETCGAELAEWQRVGPEGTIAGIAAIGDAMAVVRVRLDGADTDLIHLAGAGLKRGARVRPVWRDDRTGSILDIVRFDLATAEPTAPAAGAGGEPVTAVGRHMRLPFRLSAGQLRTSFMDGVQRGELFGNRCSACERTYVPPRPFCAPCWTQCDGWQRIADVGTVKTFVVVNVPFYGQEVDIPYVLANIQLDGADSEVLHLVGTVNDAGKLVAPEPAVTIGMRVRAEWRGPEQRRGFINDDIDHFEPEASDER